ncbi:MAG: DMT family transporter, partial [Achromobacter sp.]|nr:DMT family transporter [Achromobacter sp.]
VTWSAQFVLILVVLSIAGTSVAFWLWFGALKQVALNRANAFTFLVPIFGLAIGAVFFGERLSWAQAAGVALVVAGIAIVQLSPPRPQLRPDAAPPRRSPSVKDPKSRPTP